MRTRKSAGARTAPPAVVELERRVVNSNPDRHIFQPSRPASASSSSSGRSFSQARAHRGEPHVARCSASRSWPNVSQLRTPPVPRVTSLGCRPTGSTRRGRRSRAGGTACPFHSASALRLSAAQVAAHIHRRRELRRAAPPATRSGWRFPRLTRCRRTPFRSSVRRPPQLIGPDIAASCISTSRCASSQSVNRRRLRRRSTSMPATDSTPFASRRISSAGDRCRARENELQRGERAPGRACCRPGRARARGARPCRKRVTSSSSADGACRPSRPRSCRS